MTKAENKGNEGGVKYKTIELRKMTNVLNRNDEPGTSVVKSFARLQIQSGVSFAHRASIKFSGTIKLSIIFMFRSIPCNTWSAPVIFNY